ncbi:hypothetical protein CCHL11_05276 [Colletotrichum chlorophyti]|uniref:Ecp2 effector protein domain-containing protein n=1 Tax=Colletotrichum chlorophyti TaxID=708187 RepID=A0A1Q8RP53_9PEZI|nr:hypothetical protein CCHL11_05276 [Colletotrichum chlorophyti]
MVNVIRAAGFLAFFPLLSLITAASTATEANVDVRAAAQESVPFSFEKWADDIMPNPNGQHPSHKEAFLSPSTKLRPYGLEKRQADVSCTFNNPGGAASVADAVWCIDFIVARANVLCRAAVSGTSFCRRGQAQITGVVYGTNTPRDNARLCGNVGRSAGQITDACTRNGLVFGQNNAWGNGNLRVHIRAPNF